MGTRLWQRLVNDRSRRERWDENLAWFRLRYLDASGPERCIHLLSSAQACRRVALYYLPDAVVSRLYVGLPAEHLELLQRMSVDLNFTVTEALDLEIPPAKLLMQAEHLPWGRTFYAHVVEGHLFVDGGQVNKLAGQASYLPAARKEEEAPSEHILLQRPPVGLSTKILPNERCVRVDLPPMTADAFGWPLGRLRDSVLMVVATPINLYGSGGAVAGWLTHLVEHLLRDDPRGLIVIDGKGDLVPRLKRKASVTRLLGKQLTYVDIDGSVTAGGFNPLAPVPGESEAETMGRWQSWFGSMGVHQEGVQVLVQAKDDGVNDVMSLQGWLRRPSQQHHAAAVSSLQSALRRLQLDPTLPEWLSWPTNVFEKMPEGVLLLACLETGWARQQLLYAAALAALSLPETRLVLHGFPWSASQSLAADLKCVERVLISNGPLLDKRTVVLTRSGPEAANKLAGRFLGGDVLAEEQLQLLDRDDGMVIGKPVVTVTWKRCVDSDGGHRPESLQKDKSP